MVVTFSFWEGVFRLFVHFFLFVDCLLFHSGLKFLCLLPQMFCSFRSLVFPDISDRIAQIYGVKHQECNIDHNQDFFRHIFTNFFSCLTSCSRWLCNVISSLCPCMKRLGKYIGLPVIKCFENLYRLPAIYFKLNFLCESSDDFLFLYADADYSSSLRPGTKGFPEENELLPITLA